MKPIFIGYRRGADNAAAGRLLDRLQTEFDDAQVFMDVDDIPPGIDFVDYLEMTLATCSAMIVVIGEGWRAAIPRLHDPNDFVRREIETALARRGLRVIPLLIDDTEMPSPDELPSSLHQFTRRNGIRLRYEDFDAIVERRLMPILRKKRMDWSFLLQGLGATAVLTTLLNLWIGDGTNGGIILLGLVSLAIVLVGLGAFRLISRKKAT